MKWGSLIPWSGKRSEERRLAPIDRMHFEMDRLFDRMLHDVWDEAPLAHGFWGDWSPELDVSESDTEVTVSADIPGIAPEELEITVTGDQLTIAGKKEESTERKEENYRLTERRFGSFRRSVTLPSGIDSSDVKAEFDKGVLTVHVKKKEGAAAKRIPVETT